MKLSADNSSMMWVETDRYREAVHDVPIIRYGITYGAENAAASEVNLEITPDDLLLKFTGSCLHCRMANSGGMVGMITSGRSVQAALGSADARLLVRRSPPRLDFRQIAGMRADGPTPRKSRVRPAWISPAVRVPGGRQGAGAARPGTRAGSV